MVTENAIPMKSSKCNQLSPAFITCRDRLVDINTISQTADDIASKEKATGTKSVTLANLRFFSRDARPRVYGGHAFDGSAKILALVDETNRSFQAHCLCLAFEAVEGCLKHLGTEFYWQKALKGKPVKDSDITSFEKSGTVPPKDTREYYVEFIAWKCSSNTDRLIVSLCKELPKLVVDAKPYALNNIDLFQVLRLVAKCRHIITHDLPVDVTKLASATNSCKDTITTLCRASILDDKLAILPDRAIVGDYLELLADFCYVCYRTIANGCGIKVDCHPFQPGTKPIKLKKSELEKLTGMQFLLTSAYEQAGVETAKCKAVFGCF